MAAMAAARAGTDRQLPELCCASDGCRRCEHESFGACSASDIDCAASSVEPRLGDIR